MSSDQNQSRRVNNSRSTLIIVTVFAIFAIIVLTSLWYFGHQNESKQIEQLNHQESESEVTSLTESDSAPVKQTAAINAAGSSLEQTEPADNVVRQNQNSGSTQNKGTILEESLGGSEVGSNQPANTDAPSDTQNIVNSDCTISTKIVKDFFLHLDQQQYIIDRLEGQGSEDYFIRLIQNLVDNPPIVSRETDDLFTLLKNTAHFFRIIGKDNIIILKSILANEEDRFEVVLSHFYKLTNYENCLEEEFGLTVTKEALYDYAGFFINTMGGRLYLFRRDSTSRLTVSYYSICIIEQANREGRNTYGLDIKPPIKLLIPEIENNGSQLKLRDAYLEKLYDVEYKLP